jgi:hypothetical protein
MSKSRLQLESFDVTKLSVKPVKVNAMGSKSVDINYDGSPILIQVPRMLSFGVNKWTDTKDNSFYSTTLSFIGMERDEKIKQFYVFLSVLDGWGKQMALENSWEWLGCKTVSKETIEMNYSSSIKVAENKPASAKFKLRKSTSGTYTTKFFTKEKNLIPDEEVDSVFNKGSYVRALIQCNGFWVSNGRIGVSWKVDQMVVEPRVVQDNTVYAFTD